jgi:hypothetical protein
MCVIRARSGREIFRQVRPSLQEPISWQSATDIRHLYSITSIRLHYSPGLPFRAPHFRNYCKKPHHFYTVFLKSPFPHYLRQSERFARRCKTLMYAFGRQNLKGLGGRRGNVKGRAFLGVRSDDLYVGHRSEF